MASQQLVVLLLLAAALLCATAQQQKTLQGAARVVDGDTLWINGVGG
jgi:endonuclease YncB( thermonuclease family)